MRRRGQVMGALVAMSADRGCLDQFILKVPQAFLRVFRMAIPLGQL
jgi:hypothetical protein